jgi:three-Cys-motif partner protein
MSPSQSPAIASDSLPARLTGQWVHDKNYYLEKYLEISTRGVGRKWDGKMAYIDLFSGPGRSLIRGTQEEVDGSPLVALNCSFASYVFVDVPEVLETLKKRLKNHPRLPDISFVPGDCNDVIEKVRVASPADHLTLVFIDPTGPQIHFRTIQRLVEDRKMDLVMTIQFGMGLLMNLQQYSRSDGETLTAFLGNEDWREDVRAGGKPSQAGHCIMGRYLKQLRTLGYETVEDREIPVRSDQNNLLLYFMVLASRHPRAKDFWRKATQIQASGQRRLAL